IADAQDRVMHYQQIYRRNQLESDELKVQIERLSVSVTEERAEVDIANRRADEFEWQVEEMCRFMGLVFEQMIAYGIDWRRECADGRYLENLTEVLQAPTYHAVPLDVTFRESYNGENMSTATLPAASEHETTDGIFTIELWRLMGSVITCSEYKKKEIRIRALHSHVEDFVQERLNIKNVLSEFDNAFVRQAHERGCLQHHYGLLKLQLEDLKTRCTVSATKRVLASQTRSHDVLWAMNNLFERIEEKGVDWHELCQGQHTDFLPSLEVYPSQVPTITATFGECMGVGENIDGQLGISNAVVEEATNTWQFVRVSTAESKTIHSVRRIIHGAVHTIFINQEGKNGKGDKLVPAWASETRSTPIPTLMGEHIVAMAAGENHFIFLTADRRVWGMGVAEFGQFGRPHLPYRLQGDLEPNELLLPHNLHPHAVYAGAYASFVIGQQTRDRQCGQRGRIVAGSWAWAIKWND
ncbi:hypothetical protein HK102_001455, partial [Quaeritorhiza haematococci]